MRALITGGAGFIGSHLADALLERGYSVTVIDDFSTGQPRNIEHLMGLPTFRFVSGSIGDETLMEQLVSDCDVIFHLAAAVGVELVVEDPVRVIETNVFGTHAVLKLASRHLKKVLVASTSEIYGKSDQIPFCEDGDRLLGPTTTARWSYSTSKAVDEILCLGYHQKMGLPTVVFRLFNTVGPRQMGRYGMVFPRFVQKALRGEPLVVHGDGQQSRCFCDVADTVRAIIGLAESSAAVGRVFNVGSTHEVTILELARRVLELVDNDSGSPGLTRDGQNDRIIFKPYELAYEAGFEDMRRRVPDVTRIRETIGWQTSITLDDTIRRVIAEMKLANSLETR
jgi:UDP-glucose 4-epimerase